MLLNMIAVGAFVLAAVPTVLYFWNCRLYRPPPKPAGHLPGVSVLIPARNEASNIGPALDAVLTSRSVDFEVIVLDDDSTDETAAIILDYAKGEPRVRLVRGESLPAGWCGKQFACHQLAGHAKHTVFLFMDSDVRLAPDALARLLTFLSQSRADLVSGFPRQETGTVAERLVIPLIHFLLLGYLPLVATRRSRHPAFAAACGQLIATRRDAYEGAGGHAAIRVSLHDGLTLPRAYRRHGLRTDLCDATDLAVCRMYVGFREVWLGLAKNAREGLAAPVRILPWTVLLGGGQVVPWILLAGAGWLEPPILKLAVAAVILSLAARLHAAVRFRQSWAGALLHPVGVSLLLAIQYYALVRNALGRPVRWKGRPGLP